ncbi:S-adenosylmethionine-dependent methyltransferase [Rhinocladiella similis]
MTAQRHSQRKQTRPKKPANPLVRGILAFCSKSGIAVLDSTDSTDTSRDAAANILDSNLTLSLNDIPKRYTSYPPLLLLPHNFPTHNQSWAAVYSALSEENKKALFQCIAEIGFAGQKISRIAINAPIAAAHHQEEEDDDVDPDHDPDVDAAASAETEYLRSGEQRKKENVMRSPSGLVPVHGDWGTSSPAGVGESSISKSPTRRDFSDVFWTSASQHRGITQCWAPLYTMFSRGNVSEKARILGISTGPGTGTGSSKGGATDGDANGNGNVMFPGLTSEELQEPPDGTDVIDFYVGIGYFAFCYLMREVRRVYGWDINPWSIEGLRRGCEANGWTCLVIRVDEHGEMVDQTPVDVARSIVGHDQGRDHGKQHPGVRCVAFLGDNQWADKVMGEIQRAGVALNIRHANLGLLPTSRGSWENAVKAICGSGHDNGNGGWLHIHENVDVRDIEKMKTEITHDIDSLVKRRQASGQQELDVASWTVSCDHVEQVKTYAPGVMHCVYDVRIIQIDPDG